MILIENTENITDLNYEPISERGRTPGFSAMVRLKNEAEWIADSLLSIANVFDEIDCFLQPCDDDTEQIIRDLGLKNVRIFNYPFDSWPNGDGYLQQDSQSVLSRTYFYNWCLSKTRRSWVTKWDGDMVALDHYGNFRELSNNYDVVYEKGIDIVGQKLAHVGHRKFTGSEPRHFRVTERSFYKSGKRCEMLSLKRKKFPKSFFDKERYYVIKEPTYLHFKWAKSLESAQKAWPDNWQTSPHFQNISKRSTPVKEYNGPIPSILKGKMPRP